VALSPLKDGATSLVDSVDSVVNDPGVLSLWGSTKKRFERNFPRMSPLPGDLGALFTLDSAVFSSGEAPAEVGSLLGLLLPFNVTGALAPSRTGHAVVLMRM